MTDAEEGSIWRHMRLGVWKNLETTQQLKMLVCLDCGHTACPVCWIWCDVLDDEGVACCDGECHYAPGPQMPSAHNLVGRPHMCRFDRQNPLKRTVLVL